MADAAARIMIMAEMHARDLLRRHAALALLVALPLSYYLAASSSDDGRGAVVAGGIGLAFSMSGATLFSILSSREADQRLLLVGYRPVEMLAGRLCFLAPLALAMAGGFSLLMTLVSHPERPWTVALGVAVVGLVAVPFGLAVGAIVPRELEGTLVIIGVIGVQLATRLDTTVSKLLPFYGARRLIHRGLDAPGSLWGPLAQSALYAAGLFLVARLAMLGRLSIGRHRRLERAA